MAEVHRDLLTHEDRFLGTTPRRVLVPLCGKSVDMAWLADKGHEVIGVELVPQAVESFFVEHELEPTIEEHPDYSVYRAGNVTIFCGDMFNVGREAMGPVDRIWDRAALVALPEETRVKYTAHLRALADQGALLLQNTFEYDQSKMSGPPFSISDAEIQRHFEGCTIELLDEHDGIDKFPRFQELGNEYWTVRCYLVDL
jgi:thiopurine S-methyltransferase